MTDWHWTVTDDWCVCGELVWNGCGSFYDFLLLLLGQGRMMTAAIGYNATEFVEMTT